MGEYFDVSGKKWWVAGEDCTVGVS